MISQEDKTKTDAIIVVSEAPVVVMDMEMVFQSLKDDDCKLNFIIRKIT